MSIRVNRATLVATLICAALLLSVASQAQAVSVPISVSGWNEDIIGESGAFSPLAGSTNDYTPAAGGSSWMWYETGAPSSTQGLPNSGSFVSAFDPTVTFQFEPYTGNNAVNATAVLTLDTPTKVDSLAFLVSGSGGSWIPRLTFSDASFTDYASIANPNWVAGGPTAAISPAGLVNRLGTWSSFHTSNVMFQNDLTLLPADQAKFLTSITFTPTSSQILFAVSGEVTELFAGPVPEPSTAMLLGLGLVGLARSARRRRRLATH